MKPDRNGQPATIKAVLILVLDRIKRLLAARAQQGGR
jgi:hypothetical protein